MDGVLEPGCGSPAAGSRRTTRAACSTSSRTASATSVRTPAARALPGDPAGRVRRGHRGVSASTGWPTAPGWSTRSRSAPRRRASGSWTGSCTRCCTRSRSTGSTTSSARRRPRTCTCCGSPTACSTGCGAPSTSRRCRSTCRRRSTSPTGPSSTTPPARCWTCSSPTCSRSRPRWRWSRRRSLAAADLQAAREEVIAAFRPLDPAEVVLGQFDGYRDTEGVAPDSTTDTFVAARLWIDNARWRGVPFLLRTGKRLKASAQRISLIFGESNGPLADRLPADGTVLSRVAVRVGRDRPAGGGEAAGAGAGAHHRDGPAAAGAGAGRRPAAAVRAAHPRRADRRPVAVHPAGRAGARVGGDRPGAGRAAPGSSRTRAVPGVRPPPTSSPPPTAGCWTRTRVSPTSPRRAGRGRGTPCPGG